MELESSKIDWIAHIKSEPNKALATLYARTRNEAVSWINNTFGLQGDDAKEIYQDAIIILYNNVLQGKIVSLESNIKTYLFGICRFRVYEYFRDKKKILVKDDNFMVDIILEDEVEYKEELESNISQMYMHLNTIGDPCRSILQLYYFEKMDMTSIGDLLGYKNSETVKNLKYKCIKRLQKMFDLH